MRQSLRTTATLYCAILINSTPQVIQLEAAAVIKQDNLTGGGEANRKGL